MKHLSKTILAVLMAVLMGTLLPVQVFADTPDYISEVKVFAGDYATAESEGYTLLKNGDNPVDLNEKAGGQLGSKGDKAVYLGYKTTKERSEAITDLALMNMKGGYSVKDYELLMETQMKAQIIPFVEMFLATINEYRANFNSKNEANKKRAQYIHDILNKMTDDDAAGEGLGDLLLNVTIYEMAKTKLDELTDANDTENEHADIYLINEQVRDSLSEEERNKHADLLTIVAQSNGKATLLMENLLTRASDTSDTTWLERFKDTTYDDLIAATGKTPTDASKIIAKMCDDDAQTLLGTWEDLREALDNYDEAVETVKAYDVDSFTDASEALADLEGESPDVDTAVDALVDYKKAQIDYADYQDACHSVMIHDYLKGIEYLDGTMLDFFMQSEEEVEDDISLLYPIISSLSEGQKAGLEFLSLKEMILIGMTDMDGYKETSLDEMETVSIYDGVDRGIYEKGGVALTSDALRTDAVSRLSEEEESIHISKWTEMMWLISVSTGFAALVSGVTAVTLKTIADVYGINMWNGVEEVEENFKLVDPTEYFQLSETEQKAMSNSLKENYAMQSDYLMNNGGRTAQAYNTAYKITKSIYVGLTVALVVLTAVSVYYTYQDMVEHYKVEFTPIPHYMVDEKDLIGYNLKGEKVILKNQSAYYKAAECNRKAGDEYFDVVGTCADLNGDVGKQWLALYAVKNEVMEPILAGSLTAVVNSADIPAGYTTGIHMFGSDAAFNLNNNLYDWNNNAPSVYVYFKTDDTATSAAGANFTVGSLALSGGAGIVFGVALTALSMNTIRKKKESKTVTV